MTRRGNTPIRGIRIDAELWARTQTQAAAEGLDVSTLIRQLLRGWLDTHNEQGEK